MHLPFLQDILVLLVFSVFIVLFLQRLRLPSIIGFLVTGVVIGPNGLSLVSAQHEVEMLAEIGVILLLFVIGMELSIKQLVRIRRMVLWGGFVQVFGTIAVAATAYFLMGHSGAESVFVGFVFSLSSTAVVLKTLNDRKEMHAPHARNALAILIFQDLIVVPMMLVVPMLAGAGAGWGPDILTLLGKTAGVLLATWLLARFVLPPLLYAVAKTNSKELFLLLTLTIGFAVAFLTSEAGLSLALGAFIAGLIVSESDYSHQATSVVLPLRELFASFFFISVGMLLDWTFFVDQIQIIALLLILLLLVKTAWAALAVRLLRFPARTALLTGLALFQVGEFAFILAQVGLDAGLVDEVLYQYFLSVSIVSMLLTPFVIIGSGKLADRALGVSRKLGLSQRLDRWARSEETEVPEGLSHHLVAIGYGVNGRNVTRAAREEGIPFVVIELEPDLVRNERQQGIPMIYGDAAEEHILEAANVPEARTVVVAISDLQATRAIVSAVRRLAPEVLLVVRTRYVKEIAEIKALGADIIIPEEFETSIQIFARVLQSFLVPEAHIEAAVEAARAENYGAWVQPNHRGRRNPAGEGADRQVICCTLPDRLPAWASAPTSDWESDNAWGVEVLAVFHGEGQPIRRAAAERVQPGDLLYVLGTWAAIERFRVGLKG
jgi:CPA2 family monovalent cation:H+ antiporter-2